MEQTKAGAGRTVLKVIAAVLAAALLAGIPAGFAIYYRGEYARMAEQAQADGDRTRQEIDRLRQETEEAQAEIERLRQAEADAAQAEQELAGLREQMSGLQEELAGAQDEIRRLQNPLDLDAPEYTRMYPDFYAPQPLDANTRASKTIYLTFDDGPSARTDEVLKVLEEEGVKATFFVIGQTSGANLERMKKIVEQGHTLGMHSYSHSYNKIYSSVEGFLDDMYKIFVQIRDTTGVTPTVFRFPGGSVNAYNYGIYQDIMAEMLRRGFVPFDWNLSAQDATRTPLAVDTIVNNVMMYLGNRDRGVVLMHDSNARTTTVEALPEIIRQLREKGYSFAPLTPDTAPVLLGYKFYQ